MFEEFFKAWGLAILGLIFLTMFRYVIRIILFMRMGG